MVSWRRWMVNRVWVDWGMAVVVHQPLVGMRLVR